ncbi:major facilitator superfamily-domain-containing protein [Aspergillus coremiiformis]|uniref:Major facilitator superfamily-domain-containing protein n=1 Tax=Aspergillus coremiiformis TaxID=138285 RepID=A0A5N6Z2W0_9EURO|nr:major facilitator superfamily-domain-containing protein [Aspergillus coremiiformis]
MLSDELRPVPSAHSIADDFSLVREIAFIIVVCMSQFITQANIGICLATLDIVGDSFNITEPGVLSWFIAGYSLTVGTFILVFGRFGDVFGYHRMFLVGYVWLAIWSLVAGVSVYSNHVLFIFARVLQGLGPAMLLPNGLAVLGATYAPGKKKNMVFAIFGATAPNGAILGAVFSSLFSQLAWWPWTYWTMAIVSAVCALLGSIVVAPVQHTNFKQHRFLVLLRILDVFASSLGITGLVLVNVAWNQAPIVGWSTPYVYVLLIIGIAFLVAFFVAELFYSDNPILPLRAFTTDVTYVLGCVACGWGSFGIWVFYFWRFLEQYRGLTPLLASAQFTPPCLVGIIACFTTGYLMSRIRPGWIMLMSMTCFTLGNIFVAIAPVHQTYWALTFVCLLVIPWGMDMSFPAATLMLSNASSREHQGVAASLVTTVVNYSISLSLGFAGTVEVHVNNGGHTPNDVLKGYRGALYMAIGLGGLGMALSALYTFKSYRESPSSDSTDSETGMSEKSEK